MTGDTIPDDVRDFIQMHVDSVAQLEALLLLRANPGEVWDADKVAARLYSRRPEIAEALDRLCTHGFLVCEEGIYRYDCTPEARCLIDRVASVYARQLIPVTNMIHAKVRRIREFADAFRLRKDR
jgi:hypothetical protein